MAEVFDQIKSLQAVKPLTVTARGVDITPTTTRARPPDKTPGGSIIQ